MRAGTLRSATGTGERSLVPGLGPAFMSRLGQSEREMVPSLAPLIFYRGTICRYLPIGERIMPDRTSSPPISGLDRLDRAILRELQADGRLTNVELAKRVRLSPSPCLRRVKSLEERGFITGYRAVLDRPRMGRGLHVFVMVSLTSQRQDALEAFERNVSVLDEVLECYLMAGESDYLLAVAVADLDAYQRFFTKKLGELPGVASLRSLISMKTVKYTTSLPV
jgi:DNA-binding Lrp family transcriptional regulator